MWKISCLINKLFSVALCGNCASRRKLLLYIQDNKSYFMLQCCFCHFCEGFLTFTPTIPAVKPIERNTLNIPSKDLFRNEILSLGKQLCCVFASFHWIAHVIKVPQLECILDNGQGLHLITSNSESEHHQFCLWAVQFFKTNLPTFCPGQFPQLNSPVSHLRPHSSVHFSFHLCL